MCIGQPMRVIAQLDPGRAQCDYRGEIHEIDTRLVGEVAAGQWLMTFLGAAREVMDEQTAQQTLSAIEAVEAIMNGQSADIEAAFPDLVGREPPLPEHLRKEHAKS